MSLITAQNADDWLDVASKAFVPLTFQRVASRFNAEMDWRPLSADVSLSGVKTQAIVVDRTPRLASHATSDDIHISLQLNARGSISQGDNVSRVGPGMITVTETHKPFTLNYTEPNQRHIVLQISRDALGLSNEILSSAAGRQIGGLNPARDAYISLITSFMSESPTENSRDALEMSALVTSLASAMLRNAFESGPPHPTTSQALFLTMLEFIRAHLNSPFLSPESLAQAHFISRRKVYEIFAEFDQSPAETIRLERIHYAAALIQDPAYSTMSIADIAFQSGFSDVTTFTRAFRKVQGINPSDWRGDSRR